MTDAVILRDVINSVVKAQGMRHLITMATSEHVIMQNEALVALTIASAIDIGETEIAIPKISFKYIYIKIYLFMCTYIMYTVCILY